MIINGIERVVCPMIKVNTSTNVVVGQLTEEEEENKDICALQFWITQSSN